MLAPTVEMQIWTGEERPQLKEPNYQAYTSLGAFVPYHRPSSLPVPYAVRVEYRGRRQAKPRKGQIVKWARSFAREAGEFFVGAFQPVREAL